MLLRPARRWDRPISSDIPRRPDRRESNALDTVILNKCTAIKERLQLILPRWPPLFDSRYASLAEYCCSLRQFGEGNGRPRNRPTGASPHDRT